ncbi:putative monocarboxylate transporter 13 [Apostichopus japonicus]|uniref:Putative monocarboxylate transporter 13 n=1 Tax=Stichopus japonicus TaxID=307972 RepID=A0A2G8L3J7_STIJA|nr:putative monocarboxylate transporter 13 [Apostichopus japonicus]
MKEPGEIPTASDKGWAWVVLAAAFTNAMLLAGYMKGIGVFFVEWQENFGANAKDVGWVGVIIGFFTSVGALLAGALATRLACQKVIIIAGLLFAASVAAGSFTSDMWQLYITNCIAGISLGLCLQPGWTSIGYNFHRWLGLANGVSSAGVGMGIVALPPLIQFFCNKVGWRGALQVTGAFMVMTSVCGVLVRPTPKELFLIKQRENTKKVTTSERRQRCSVTLESGVVVYRETLFEKLISAPVHSVTDNLGLKLLVQHPSFANPFVSTYSMLIAIAVWFGLFSGLSYSMAVYCARLCVPADKVSSSIGVVLLSEGVGVLFGVFFMGLIRDLTSNYDMSFLMCGGSFVLASVVVFCDSFYLEITERRRSTHKEDIKDTDHVTKSSNAEERKKEENANVNQAYDAEEEDSGKCVISIVSATNAVLQSDKNCR